MDSTKLLELMKSHKDAYLTAYQTGYEQGWKDATARAFEIMNERKRAYKKEGKPE